MKSNERKKQKGLDILNQKKFNMYHSVIIEESLENPRVLKNYKILRTRFVPGKNWHLDIIEIPRSIDEAIKEIQEATVADKPYYFHIYDEGKTLIVVFKDKIFHLDPNNQLTWQEAREYGASELNIPPDQLDFSPSKISKEEQWYRKD